jgi:hypothetical protein
MKKKKIRDCSWRGAISYRCSLLIGALFCENIEEVLEEGFLQYYLPVT